MTDDDDDDEKQAKTDKGLHICSPLTYIYIYIYTLSPKDTSTQKHIEVPI